MLIYVVVFEQVLGLNFVNALFNNPINSKIFNSSPYQSNFNSNLLNKFSH